MARDRQFLTSQGTVPSPAAQTFYDVEADLQYMYCTVVRVCNRGKEPFLTCERKHSEFFQSFDAGGGDGYNCVVYESFIRYYCNNVLPS